MLEQLDLYIKSADTSELFSNLGVKLHGFIMSRIDSDYAKRLHNPREHTPFSLFVFDSGEGFICRISTLTDEASQILDAMQNVGKIKVYGITEPLTIENMIRSNPIVRQDIVRIVTKKKYVLNFITPAVYKKDGKFCNMPELYRYFRTVVEKINRFESMDIEYRDIAEIFESYLKVGEYRYESSSYLLGGYIIPAMIGGASISIAARKEESDNKPEILRLLLGYATFSGVGGKTSLGMGGTLLIGE